MWPFGHTLCHDGMFSPGPGNFEMVNSIRRGFSTGIMASNWDQACSTTLVRPNLGHTLCHDGMWPFLRNIWPGPGNLKWSIPFFEASALGSGPQIRIRHAPPHSSDPIQVTYCVMMACGHSCEIFGQGLGISKWLIPFAEASSLGSGPQSQIRHAPTH
jgi:hypothetical protein